MLSFVHSISQSFYVLALMLGLIIVISIMISDILVPNLGNSRPVIVNSVKPAVSVARNWPLSFIFKQSSERNERLFADVCGNCHNVNDVTSHKVGPNL